MTTTALPATLRSVDWSGTPVGLRSDWPRELETLVSTLLPSPVPIMICWGEDLVQIYNDAFAVLLGDRHPAALGQPAAGYWAHEPTGIGPVIEGFLAGDPMELDEDFPLFVNRHGYPEETYWDFSGTVIRGEGGERRGVMLSGVEETVRVVSNRRLNTVHELSVMSTAGMMSLEEVCRAALKVMSGNRPAMPFAACYLREGGGLRLVASYGSTAGRAAFLGRIDGEASLTIGRAARTGLQEMVENLGEIADSGRIEASPLGEAVPTSAMLLPLLLAGEMEPLGIVVLGINPYRAVDAAYRSFFDLVSRQLGTLLTDAQAHQEQRGRAETLAAIQESQTRFFQNVSHEFRTPLTLVLGALDGLGSATAAPEAEDLAAARRAALRLDRLVDALLTFARAESGALVAQRQPTDLARLTFETASMFRSAIEAAGLEYVVELPDAPLVGDVDQRMWSTIVVNLVSNAHKYTAEGRIWLSLSSSADGVTLTVEDTGAGIEPGALGQVFQRFRQERHTTQVRSDPGAGIGLSLVKDLVRAQQGRIEVTSEPGVGSTFTVSLPLKTVSTPLSAVAAVDERIHAQTIADLASAVNAPRSRSDAAVAAPEDHDGTAPDPARRRRLLLVEDNADLRQYLVRLLRGSGWAVTAVPDAESALRHHQVPDLILTDIMLPGQDGLSLVRTIRATPGLAAVPVIVLTARAGAEAATEGLRAGANDYVVKPFNAEELLARLDVHHELTCLRNYALAQAENHASNLEQALSSNRTIGAAIGVLMTTRKVTSEAAFQLLRRASNESNRNLRDVADRVVLTGSLGHVASIRNDKNPKRSAPLGSVPTPGKKAHQEPDRLT